MDKDISPLVSRDTTAGNGNDALCLYLERYHLSVEAVARICGVPMMTVWRIKQGEPVGIDKAARVRRGLYQLTNVPYMGPIATLSGEEHTNSLRPTRLTALEKAVM